MNTALNRVIDTVLGALDLFRFWVVLYEYEAGIILRLGHLNRELGPGLHWRRPLKLEELRYVNTRKKTSSSWEMTQTTSDGVTVSFSFDYIIEVADAKYVLLNVDDWEYVAYQAAKIILANHIRQTTYDELVKPECQRVLYGKVGGELQCFGIQLDRFGLTDFAKTRCYKLFKGATK